MTFKTKEEMFGDGGAHGAQVPISTSNPAGHNATVRGIGFGEGVTSAIGNRAAYALALNDEDLNDRIVPFETTGLDAAYRNGLADTPENGRKITLDGGAIETLGGAVDDILLAHIRTAIDADEVGIDAAGFGTALVHRAPVTLTGNTVISSSGTAGTLNPSGAGADLIEIGGGGTKFSTSGDTAMLVAYDLIEVSGSATPGEDGLYRVVAFVSDIRVQVVDRYGDPAFFASTGSATIKVHRITVTLGESTIAGAATAPTGLPTIYAAHQKENPPTSCFGVLEVASDGETATVRFVVLPDGNVKIIYDNTEKTDTEMAQLPAPLYLETSTSRNDGAASAAAVIMNPALYIVDGVISAPSVTATPFLELNQVRYTWTVPSAGLVDIPAAIDFVAGTNKIEFSDDATVLVDNLLAGNIIRLVGTSRDGFYILKEKDETVGNGRLTLKLFDNSSPVFPAGSGTAMLYAVSRGHNGLSPFLTISPTNLGPLGDIFDNVTPSFDLNHQLQGGALVRGGSLAVVKPGTGSGDANNKHNLKFLFAVDGDTGRVSAKVVTCQGLRSSDDINLVGAINEVIYDATRTRTVRQKMAVIDKTGTWSFNTTSGGWSTAAAGEVYFELELPYGAELPATTDILGIKYSQNEAVSVLDATLYSVDDNSTFTSIGTASSPGSTGTNVNLAMQLTSGNYIHNSATKRLVLKIVHNGGGSPATLRINTLKLTFKDPGPRNY